MTIWIAYSGGVDSHVLLHLMATNFESERKNLRAIHINDHLSPNSDRWQQHCVQVCAQLKVPITCVSVDATPKPGQSPEDAARNARRQAWLQHLAADDQLILAHHANDQAETILYRLFRGAGPQGLSGMAMRSKLGVVQLLRPLLNISKHEILVYAQGHNLQWIEDESNADQNFDRNFIRQQILPRLVQRWPAVVDNISRSATLCAKLTQRLKPIINEYLGNVLASDRSQLDLRKWQTLPEVWREEVLRAWLQEQGVHPSLQQLSLIQSEVIGARHDAMPEFKLAGRIIRRAAHKIYLLPIDKQDLPTFSAKWDLSSDLVLPNGQILRVQDWQTLQGRQLMVKLGNYGAKAKKIFQQYEIPPWQRTNFPLIFVEQRLVAIVGLWVRDSDKKGA